MAEFLKPEVFTDEFDTYFVLNSDYTQVEAEKLFKEKQIQDGYDDLKITKIYIGYTKKGDYLDNFEYVICGATAINAVTVWIAKLEGEEE